ncbi:HET-domain-containing protein, partial [Colletotrichum caudatum]
MAITINCANALRRLRFPGWARDVWVDAICINQEDSNERSHQVGIMQYIYATAIRVVVYLGED